MENIGHGKMVRAMDDLNKHKKAFVFVVCGTKEHLDTLAFSLKYLKRYSKLPIIVLTDKSRNEVEIAHSNVIHIETPKEFNHHKASIYLKTGIHLFLPKGNHYCYLDTDVVALREDVDLIFNEYIAPITFAPDHCTLETFSPYGVNCPCLKENQLQVDQLHKLLNTYDYNVKLDAEAKQSQDELIKLFNMRKQNKISYLLLIFKYLFARKTFHLENFYLKKHEKVWYDKRTQKAILYDFSIVAKEVSAQSTFKWNKWKRAWVNEKNQNIFELACAHLPEAIDKFFDIKVRNKQWQHWNGGVFLFDDESHDFLNAWHNKSLQIFNLPDWKTRDQGTLIATAWEFGLEKHKNLSKKWNFIADYNKAGLDFNQEGFFTDDYWKTKYEVSFVHIYHHWGDETWDLWGWVQNIEL